MSERNTACSFAECELCNKNLNVLLRFELRKHGWKQRLIIAFGILDKCSQSEGNWHSLTTEIFPFLDVHWTELWKGKKAKPNDLEWRKKVQDCLTHNRDVFQSAMHLTGKKGYWRMVNKNSEQMNDSSSLLQISKLVQEYPIEVSFKKRTFEKAFEEQNFATKSNVDEGAQNSDRAWEEFLERNALKPSQFNQNGLSLLSYLSASQ